MGLENREYYRDEESVFGRNYESTYGKRSIVVTIIIINAVIFLLDAFSSTLGEGRGQLDPVMNFLAMDTDTPWKFWNWLTHGFAHSSLSSDIGFWHIAGNMLTLFFLGRPVEMRLGRDEFLKFYLLAILVSGGVFLVYSLLVGKSAFVVGASGAVSAVVALFICCYPKQKLLLMGIVPMPAWVLGLLLIGTDINYAFRPDSHVAWQAHMGGAAFGAAYYFLKWNFSRLPNPMRLGDFFKSKPKIKIHQPSQGFEKLKAQADEALAKIAEHGEESLSRRERKILTKYSNQIRKQRD